MHKLALAALAITLNSAAQAQYYRPYGPPQYEAPASMPHSHARPWWVPEALPPGSPEFRIPDPPPVTLPPLPPLFPPARP